MHVYAREILACLANSLSLSSSQYCSTSKPLVNSMLQYWLLDVLKNPTDVTIERQRLIGETDVSGLFDTSFNELPCPAIGHEKQSMDVESESKKDAAGSGKGGGGGSGEGAQEMGLETEKETKTGMVAVVNEANMETGAASDASAPKGYCCQYCNKTCGGEQGLWSHERWCGHNTIHGGAANETANKSAVATEEERDGETPEAKEEDDDLGEVTSGTSTGEGSSRGGSKESGKSSVKGSDNENDENDEDDEGDEEDDENDENDGDGDKSAFRRSSDIYSDEPNQGSTKRQGPGGGAGGKRKKEGGAEDETEDEDETELCQMVETIQDDDDDGVALSSNWFKTTVVGKRKIIVSRKKNMEVRVTNEVLSRRGLSPGPEGARATQIQTHAMTSARYTVSEHRKSCHMCGNLRSRNVLCNRCVATFCANCATKSRSMHGNAAFDRGCPLCNNKCCCAGSRVRRFDCTLPHHCYKKCRTQKRARLLLSETTKTQGASSETGSAEKMDPVTVTGESDVLMFVVQSINRMKHQDAVRRNS